MAQQVKEALVAQSRPQERLVVAREHQPPHHRVAAGQLAQLGDEHLAQLIAGGAPRLVLLQRLAARGGPQLVGLDDATHEARPRGQEILGVVADQHAAHEDREVAVVGGAVGRAILNPQQAASGARLAGGDVEGAEGAEGGLEVSGEFQRPLAPPQRREGGLVPGRYLVHHRPAVHRDRHLQQPAVAPGAGFDDARVGQHGQALLEAQDDPGADGARLVRRDRVALAARAVEVPGLAGRLVARGEEIHRLGDRVGREEADAELPNHFAATGLAQLPRVAGGHGGEEPIDLLSREPGAGVFDGQRALGGVGGDAHLRLEGRGVLEPTPHTGVVAVLHQLAEHDLGRRVEVVGQQRQQARQVDLGSCECLQGHRGASLHK